MTHFAYIGPSAALRPLDVDGSMACGLRRDGIGHQEQAARVGALQPEGSLGELERLLVHAEHAGDLVSPAGVHVVDLLLDTRVGDRGGDVFHDRLSLWRPESIGRCGRDRQTHHRRESPTRSVRRDTERRFPMADGQPRARRNSDGGSPVPALNARQKAVASV
jgi:hypothetical protein